MGRVSFLMNFEVSAYRSVFRIASGLLARGHEVVFLVPRQFEELVAGRGLAHRCIGPPPFADGLDLEEKVRQLSDNVGAAVAEVRPDLVVLDQLLWSLAAPLLGGAVPVLPASTSLAGALRLDVPPAFDGRPPPERFAAVRNLPRWLRHLLVRHPASNSATLQDLVLRRTPYAAMQMSAWRALRRAGGRVRWGEYGLRLAGAELVLCPRAFDYPFARPRGRVYAGTCIDLGADAGEPDAPWLAEPLQPGERIVYCSVGSHGSQAGDRATLFRAVIGAAAARSQLRVVVQIGRGASDEGLGPLPPNVTLSGWAPQTRVLSRAAVFITHGGLSSVKEALYFGVPMLVFPFFNDGFGNAARVRFHGVGLDAPMDTADATTVGRMIDRALARPIREAVGRLSAKVRLEEACGPGIDHVERTLRAHGVA